ncbi:serine hydrolase [Alphaproteobacteria bacterium GH1-50]|uniref:Serine hydrolase n=1 Tax=Kangsaoukella pontilimi TaxID=2691042 RepID=A0A7C9MF43_9RHOB|nr:serine hydrolase [Kangsaoukella pontilimi]MXQ08672.1 serine hydrolase [Kangsaoukella pontilimi]
MTCDFLMTRRQALAGLGACLAAPAIAATDRLAPALEKARGFGRVRGFLVLKEGERLAAERMSGPALDRPVNIKSVSKTIVASLTGAAIDRGVLPSSATTIGEAAPALLPRGADPRVAGITVEDLVTLRAGLERTSGANYGAWVSSGNWVADALSRPFVADPGGRMLYSTGSTHVLGAILAEASGRSLLSLARDWLGDPLGIEVPAWTRDPQGYYLGGNEMALSVEGMGRFGEMIRQGGIWQGERVLSEEWIEQSFVPRTRSPWSGLAYGYGWFLGRAGGASYALARGFGGQVIAVSPQLGVTVVITSDPTQPARSNGYFGELQDLIERDVFGALS